jgi:hypothetical protein
MSDPKADAQERLQANPVRHGIYRHYKGGLYYVFACSLDESSLTELVHYYSLERKTCWTRSRLEFFELIEVERDGYDEARFVFQRREMADESLEFLARSWA